MPTQTRWRATRRRRDRRRGFRSGRAGKSFRRIVVRRRQRGCTGRTTRGRCCGTVVFSSRLRSTRRVLEPRFAIGQFGSPDQRATDQGPNRVPSRNRWSRRCESGFGEGLTRGAITINLRISSVPRRVSAKHTRIGRSRTARTIAGLQQRGGPPASTARKRHGQRGEDPLTDALRSFENVLNA